MIPVLSSQEMKKLDDTAKAGELEKGFALMQKAARIAFDLIISEILKRQKTGQESKVLVLAGKGNNGGDGLLTAAYLFEQGYDVECFLFAEATALQAEAKMAYDYLEKVKAGACSFIKEDKDLLLLKNCMDAQLNSDHHCYVLDAIYGVGYQTGRANPLLQVTAEIINNSPKEKTVIAIDLPSGMNADNGALDFSPIKANYSLAMGFPKLGSFFFPARAFVGIILVGNLQYENTHLQEAFETKMFFIDNVKAFFPGRALNGSKYDHGTIVNIAGGQNMTGAAILSSKAAYRSGLGLVTLYTANQDSVFSSLAEAIVKDINELSIDNLIQDPKVDCISIGPGLGRDYDEKIFELVEKSTKPLVLDADAINAFQGHLEKLKKHKAEIIITPHFGEYKRLFGDELNDPLEAINTIKQRAREFNITILLKGAPSLIADPCGEVYILPYGNSGLATAGSGDVLTGVIAAMVAQTYKRQNKYLTNSSLVSQSAILATYLHGKTAELIAPETSEYSMTASDIVNNLHRAIKSALN